LILLPAQLQGLGIGIGKHVCPYELASVLNVSLSAPAGFDLETTIKINLGQTNSRIFLSPQARLL